MKQWICTVIIIFCSSISYAGNINSLYIFGDSLSDNGNFYASTFPYSMPAKPYYHGRFTNGKVWVEQLNSQLGFDDVDLYNYAYGGAQSSADLFMHSLPQQIDDYMKHAKNADADGLYIIWIGANNYLGLLDGEFEITDEYLYSTVQQIQQGVERLVQHGAKNILVLNLPDLGNTPWAHEKVKHDIAFPQHASDTAIRHNNALQDQLTLYTKLLNHSGVTILLFDSFELMNELLDNPNGPASHLNITQKCYTGDYYGRHGHVCEHPDEYAYFDHIHPTKVVHELVADAVYGFLQNNLQVPSM